MSILQEYEKHQKFIKKEVMMGLEKYIAIQNRRGIEINYSDIMYNPDK